MLAVLLGASTFPNAPNLAEGRAFYLSAADVKEYLCDEHGLALPRLNVFSLFDDSRSPSDQLMEVANFLVRRTRELKNEGSRPEDLLIYYVGHGLFTRGDQAYCLAVRSTNEINEGATSIRAGDLAGVIKENAAFLRRYLILDCCYSANIHKEFQSGALNAVRIQIANEFPERGTALMCSSNAHEPSLAPQGFGHTMFSDALLKALRKGHEASGPRLSFNELGALIHENLRNAYPEGWVRPEVLSPDQREGDIAHIPMFPNPAYRERETVEDHAGHALERGKPASAVQTRPEPEHERQERERAEAAEKERVAAAPAAAAELAARRNAEPERIVLEKAQERAQEKVQEKAHAEGRAPERDVAVGAAAPKQVGQNRMSLQPGDTIADYQIQGILGQGGMGAVYRVRNLLSGREEAMKVVLPAHAADAEATDRFLREIKIQASLQHPNITALRTAVRADNDILMIMELVDGESLEAKLRNGPLSLAQAIRIADDILGALGYAHERGVVHRDVKPANILVTWRGLPKLMDFGIARAAGDTRLTNTGMAMGSLHYMSPEQVLSKPADERSDIYSMGATFYEMLTGRPPAEGGNQYALMQAHLWQVPAAPSDFAPGVPREVSSVVMKSLAKAPEERFQTAAEFQAALRQCIFGTDSTQAIPVASARPQLEQAELARLETRLAGIVGPIAKALVARAAPHHSSIATLCRDLAEQIPGEADRIGFLRAFGLASGSQAAPPGAPSQSAPLDLRTLDARTLDAARAALAVYLGPMAGVLVNRAARHARSVEQLKTDLAAEIPDERARRTFLASF